MRQTTVANSDTIILEGCSDFVALNSPLKKSLCMRGRVIVAEDKARDRVESGDSGRECNADIRPQGPDAARMDFFNGLLKIHRTDADILDLFDASCHLRHRG